MSNIGGIFAYIKVGLVFLTLYCIERKLNWFSWQQSSTITFCHCILSLFSSTFMLAILPPKQRSTEQRVRVFYVGIRCTHCTVRKKLALVNTKGCY